MVHVMRIASGGQCRTKCANGGVAPAILPPLVQHRTPSLVLHWPPL